MILSVSLSDSVGRIKIISDMINYQLVSMKDGSNCTEVLWD